MHTFNLDDFSLVDSPDIDGISAGRTLLRSHVAVEFCALRSITQLLLGPLAPALNSSALYNW